jgi:NhaP-type Na+/H+ or K+/H+ antiporter
LVGFGATLILFGGGLETAFDNFKKLFGKIASLSFVGLGFTAVAMSLTIHWLGGMIGLPLSIAAAVLLGALLASTDPAAIIPVLKRLRFHNPDTKDILVSESAITDVTGTLLTVAFLSLAAVGGFGASVLAGYSQIFSIATGVLLLKQIIFGAAFGVVGYALLHALTKFKDTHKKEYEADSAFFLFIPIVIFTFALAFGGSGYLAAFIAGLLFKLTEKLHETERFFNHTIDGFFKPTIFLMLGALVDLPSLIAYAPLGLLVSVIFMFLIRPVAVFLSLLPYLFLKKNKITARDALFISFVRETGAIPAVLLVTIASLALPNIEGLLPVGMWVILATLIVEPPLTPWVAEKLKVAELLPEPTDDHIEKDDSLAIIGSRGHSWKNRLPFVVDWCARHHVPNLSLLLCLEYKYTPEMAEEIADEAKKMMFHLNAKLERRAYSPISFQVEISEGLLQKNIDRLSKTHENLVAIFVGRKMLDYRLDEVKQLEVPIFFMK